MSTHESARATWLAHLLSTAPADRPRAEDAVRRLYAAAGFPVPRHVVWYDSPRAASWAVALLAAPYSMIWRDRFGGSLSRDDRAEVDRARASLGAQLGTGDWNAVLAAAGAPRGSGLQWPPDVRRMFSSALLEARFALVDDVMALRTVPGDEDDLARAESGFHGGNRGVLRSAIHCPTTDGVLAQSWYEEYPMSRMADDAARAAARGVEPPLLRAAWDLARSAGLWWPFEGVAVLADRPAELHVNERDLLHCTDGPALAYRDGWRVFAWNGKAVYERWIMDPASVPPREYKGFDPTFTKHVASLGGAARPKPKKPPRRSMRTAILPADPSERLEELRAYGGGTLPRFARYQAGEHQAVWTELVALGADVREEPQVADALAVAYATMERVAANVDTVVDRLQRLGYIFAPNPGDPAPPRDRTARPRVPPSATVRKQLVTFEKSGGPLPLSLRAFYDVVGEVNLIGHHPSIAPRSGRVAPDPLVVYGFDEGALEFDEEDDERPSAITIAPDDLHKADTSGGDAYEMAIPDPRADGELLNERHALLFVDYLRLCFRFGGFPGYEGQERVPPEIAILREGLLPF